MYKRKVIKNNQNKGFTIIEMVVTMLVLAIVLTLSIGGLLAWQDWADFNRQNEYARTLFVAAQNQLTEYDADGRLKELQDSLSGGVYDDKTGRHYTAVGLNLTDHITALKNAEGNSYGDLGSLYPESGDKGEDTKLYQGEIVSLRAQTGDYASYLADPAGLKASDPDAYWVFEILGAYVYDTSILNGDRKADGSGNGAAICVELTPDDGQVLAVLYSDKNDKFIYTGIPGDPDGSTEENSVSDITDRTEAYRKDRMVGYYGVDTLYTATKSEILEPSISSVRLYNKDDFYLACRLGAKDRDILTSRLTYTMNIHGSADDNDKLLTITLDGTKLKNQANAEAISCPVSRYDVTGSGISLGEFPVLAWVEPDYTIHVVLDAADIQATTDLYERELNGIRSSDKAVSTKFSKTYSYFRFGVKADNLFASVTADGADFAKSETMRNYGNRNPFLNQMAKHATFAGEDTSPEAGKTRLTYSIKNARHLYNMRYIEDLPYGEEPGHALTADEIAGVTFIVKSDIDWQSFQKGKQLYDTYSAAGNIQLFSLNGKLLDETGKTIDSVTRLNCDFPSVSRIRARDTLVGEKSVFGDTKEITGISVTEVSNALYGIYNSDDPGKRNAGELDTIRPSGLVNVNYGTIKDLKLDRITVSGNQFVGSFCGINAGKTENLETMNTDGTSLIAGNQHVGGIMGFQMPTTNDLVISGLTNRARVEGVRAVGGIVGMVRNDFSVFHVSGSGLVWSELTELSEPAKSLFNSSGEPTVKFSVKISDCTNYGSVLGCSFTDLMEVYTSGEARVFSVEPVQQAENASFDPEESRYIGGIVGYSYNCSPDDTSRVTIVNCTSAPLYEVEELANITSELSDESNLKQKLKGTYVGGIAGYNYFGQINKCSTEPEKGKVGCLFGYRYVGGIVGFNIGPASGIVGSDTSKPGENQNHVVAYEYAGGITGCNATAGDKDSENNDVSVDGGKDPENLKGILIPDAKRALDVKIDNWVNKGVAIAVHEYSGGITGYNAGFIYRCNSEVNEADAEACFTPRDSSNDAKGLYSGNYAGGIAGYNNGIIGNSERRISIDYTDSTLDKKGTGLSTACYVKGHHYVGGIVGYNDVNSIVEDYEVGRGYVLGDEGSCFVGGYAGLNVSVDLLMDRSESETARNIHSNPTQVGGSYFVGGVIGGNIINMADNKDITTIQGAFLTDNDLGILKGREFVGGFIGYNLLFDNDNDTELVQQASEGERHRGAVYIVQRRLVEAFESSDADASVSDARKKLADKKAIVDSLFKNMKLGSTLKEKSDESVLVCISGEKGSSTMNNFGSISGEIYVGGVLGYNDENTKLTIENVENATAIVATNAIEYDGEQKLSDGTPRKTDYVGADKTYMYSYAGGMIGEVGKNTILDNCRNASTGTVQTAGTYTGGLCEVNEGLIQNCQLSSFGNSMQDYVGGLCGLNKSTITNCTFKNKTVSGRNVVGGITAENFGTISDITLDRSKLLVEGIHDESEQNGDGVSGLYAAFNGYSGQIPLKKDITGVSVKSSGRYVGLVVGVNEGNVKNEKREYALEIIPDEKNYLVLDGKVQGYQTVGGLIGLNRSQNKTDKINFFTNQASVTATNGNAGGIIGENQSDNIIWLCVNDGVVTASDEGNAGGITSSNRGLISMCKNYQTVSAPEGLCGGITAVNTCLGANKGTIINCTVKPHEGKSDLVFRSTKVVGGIAAQNSGVIGTNTMKHVTVTNETAVENTRIGVIVGENLAGGAIYLSKSSLLEKWDYFGILQLLDILDINEIEDCRAIVRSNYSNAGGIAGTNAGTIKGTKGKPSVVSPNLSMENATLASLGGVAGSNTGTIENVAVDAKIQGELGSSMTGYGGIAGVSGYESQEQLADVQKDKDTKEYAAIIKNCSFDGVINAEGSSGAPVRVGGIVGVNGYGSLVQDCCIGVRSSESGGTISDVSEITYITAGDYVNKTADSVNTTDTKSYSYLGGIVGDNYGSILACDNADNSMDTVKIIGFAGETGGIAGYNEKYGVVSGYLDKDRKTEHYLTTGKKWSVEQRCCGNDRGPGGIIGKSVSAEDMSYVKNYAPVTCSYKANTYVAGLIGVLGQQYKMKTRFYKCENYGDINSYRSAGGLVGMLESNGADFYECKNWGNVYGQSRNSGGFVAIHYAFAAGLDFRHCANHGNVSGKGEKIGGFVGGEENVVPENYGIDGKVVNHLYDCVNTGIIEKIGKTEPDSNTGVFYGRKEGQSRVIMELCRNYNTNKSANGFIGNSGDRRFKNCLDNSGVTTTNEFTPFGSGKDWNANMFYLDQKSQTTFSHEDYGVYFSFTEGSNAKFSYNGLSYNSQLNDPSFLFSEPDKSNKIVVGKNGQLNISLDYASDSQGLDSMVVYFWNGSDKAYSDSTTNTYSVTATYVYSDGTWDTTETKSAQGYYDVVPDAKVVLQKPSNTDKRPVQVRLKFDTSNANAYLRGISYIPVEESATGTEAMCIYRGTKNDTTATVSYYDRQEDNSIKNTHLKLTERDGKKYVYLPYDYNTGFYMTNNPVDATYYSDTSDYTTSLTDGKDSGSRIDTYLELDPKYVELTEDLCTVQRKLDVPSKLTLTEGNAAVRLTWNKSRDAYAYELYYSIIDGNGTTVFSSDKEMVGSLQMNYNIPLEDNWKTSGYRLVVHLRAINAYHFDHDDDTASDYDSNFDKYDSEWTTVERVIEKQVLPKPEVHMEVVAGNRTTFVLDNYEEYVKKNCTDITIKLYYKPSNVSSGTDYTWNVAEEGKYSNPQKMTGSPSGPADFRYYAAPNELLKDAYTTSEVHYQRGEGHGNSDLEKNSAYCKTTFQGFFGTEAGSMDYRIQFTLNSQDTYLKTDISAYDPQVGATVGYDSEITHAANSYSGGGTLKLTSTLKNLPDDWFSSDCKDKITVRAYPYHSQFDLIHYGHPVAERIKLNGTVEENRAVLAGIYDKEYIAKDADNPVSNCVWDEEKQDLKSGYLLQKQDDGTYDVIYSSVIEMSQTAAAEQNDPYREYYNYDIAYRIYSNMEAETDNEIVVNSMDFQESYWSRGNTKSNGDADINNYYKTNITASNNRQYVQEIQSAPIVNDPAITTDDQEHTVYEFSWDTYYQDTACWDNNVGRYFDKNKLTNPPEGLFRTWDSYMKKMSQAGLSDQQISDGSNFCGLMNVYYESYRTAEYRVDLIGTTQDGKEVILASQTVNDPTQQKLVENMTTKGGKPTTYNVWDYRCSFTDTDQTWKNYPKMTARVMRLGNLSTIEFYKSGGTLVKPVTDPSGASCMLPRYTDTVVFQKLRLNTISKPTVSLLKENGQFITDDLVYEVAWGAITDKKQKEDLGGYLITASVIESADQTQGSNTHYYYVSDVGADGDVIGLDADALEASGVVTDVGKYYTRSGNKCKTQINLSDFNTNDVVQISVKAIARKQAENYTDGEEGVSIEIKIPKRLAVPDTTKLKVSLAANGSTVTTDPVDMETYQKGLSFRYEPGEDEYASVADAKIRMAVAVCDSAPDTQDDKNQVEVQEWEKNARKVLYTKEKPLNLGKVSEESSVVVKLTELEHYPGEYAGKWLKIALKASSATKIDSQWTDQDPDEKTINYAWVQLPKLNLKDVDLAELSKSDEGDVIRYACDGKITNESMDPNRETPIATKSLRFSEDRNVNGYHIGITGTADSPDGQAPVYDLYLQRHLKDSTNETSFDGTWDVYLSTNGAITVSDDSGQQPVCEQKQEATWIGLIGIPFTDGSDSDNRATQLIEIKDIRKDIEISSATYSMNAQLRYTVNTADQTGSFVIVLPDVTMIEEIPYSADYFTTEVSIEQYIKDSAPYIAGKGAVYTRGSGIRITAIEKGGDGQHEENANTVVVKALARIAKIGKLRSSNDHGSDRWSSGAGILSVSPFDRILTVCANIQTNGPAAVQAVGTELFRIIGYGIVRSVV